MRCLARSGRNWDLHKRYSKQELILKWMNRGMVLKLKVEVCLFEVHRTGLSKSSHGLYQKPPGHPRPFFVADSSETVVSPTMLLKQQPRACLWRSFPAKKVNLTLRSTFLSSFLISWRTPGLDSFADGLIPTQSLWNPASPSRRCVHHLNMRGSSINIEAKRNAGCTWLYH
jgi:hypothetical protein